MPERKIDYQRLDNKLATGFFITAPSLQRLYIDAALALTDLQVSLDRVGESDKKTVDVMGKSKEDLMLEWLKSLLTLFENDQFLAHRIVFNRFDGRSLQATLFGEAYSPIKHGHIEGLEFAESPPLQMGDGATPEPHFFVRAYFVSSRKKMVATSGR